MLQKILAVLENKAGLNFVQTDQISPLLRKCDLSLDGLTNVHDAIDRIVL